MNYCQEYILKKFITNEISDIFLKERKSYVRLSFGVGS